MNNHSIDSHFAGKEPVVQAIYDRLLLAMRRWGEIEEDAKKTSIHLNRKTAVAGITTRKNYILLNIKNDHPISSPRIQKQEQLSANRFHHRVRLDNPDDVNEELLTWLHNGYNISG